MVIDPLDKAFVVLFFFSFLAAQLRMQDHSFPSRDWLTSPAVKKT